MDTNAFHASIQQNYSGDGIRRFPDSSTLTYEGVFNEQRMQCGPRETEHVVSASAFPFVADSQPWVGIWLKSKLDGASPRACSGTEVLGRDASGRHANRLLGGD